MSTQIPVPLCCSERAIARSAFCTIIVPVSYTHLPVQTFKCLLHKSPLRAELVDGADFLCIRELTGGMYFGEKYQDNDLSLIHI